MLGNNSSVSFLSHDKRLEGGVIGQNIFFFTSPPSFPINFSLQILFDYFKQLTIKLSKKQKKKKVSLCSSTSLSSHQQSRLSLFKVTLKVLSFFKFFIFVFYIFIHVKSSINWQSILMSASLCLSRLNLGFLRYLQKCTGREQPGRECRKIQNDELHENYE